MTPHALRKDDLYTYADYMEWNEGRWEIIDGEIFDMTPAPRRVHQEILTELVVLLGNYFKTNPCRLYAAPFDVRLVHDLDSSDQDIHTVVQPDIVVVCDEEKLDERGCKGAPDFIIEILSPSTATRDLKTKRDLYEHFGVPEYCLVHPTDEMAMVYRLNEQGIYDKAEIYGREDSIVLRTFPDLALLLADVFSDTRQ